MAKRRKPIKPPGPGWRRLKGKEMGWLPRRNRVWVNSDAGLWLHQDPERGFWWLRRLAPGNKQGTQLARAERGHYEIPASIVAVIERELGNGQRRKLRAALRG